MGEIILTTKDKVLVTRSSLPPLEEYVEEIRDIWESHWLTNMGLKHRAFQQELTQFLGVDHIELLTNGHMALELSLQALGIGRSGVAEGTEPGEVITTPYTFVSTTHAIVRNGLKPVFCDINPVDFTIDVTKIEELITERTVAIMPVHVYGNVCDVEAIDRIAKKHGLKVIYDAAHTFGETYKGKGIGSFGDVSVFSFHATKVFNSIEGGAVAFGDAAFGSELYKLKNFGIKNEEVVDGIGANAKMNEFCAAMGLCNLRHLPEEIGKRKKIHNKYMTLLSGIPGIALRVDQEGVEYNYSYFPIVVDPDVFGCDRNDLYEILAAEGIGTRKYFYPITSACDCYEGCFDPAQTPVALRVSERVLTLPMYADLELDTVEKICNIIRSASKPKN